MGEVVNLRRARKARARDAAGEVAAQNRARFGVAKGAREVARALSDLSERRLDGHARPVPRDDDA